MRNIELITRLSIYVGYIVLRSIFILIQRIFWICNGTYVKLRHSRKTYSCSAHVQNVKFRYKLDALLEPSTNHNFISTHHSFEHPDYIRKHNITLYYVTRTEAIFVESDPAIDAFHSDFGSFVRGSQFVNARKVITLPMEYFHKIAETIGAPKGKIVFVSNTARCGSTLICQLFEQTGYCSGLSEPDAMNAMNEFIGKIPQSELDRLVVNIVHMLCKPKEREIAAFALKTTAPTMYNTPMLNRLFPDAVQIFMFREGHKVAPSLDKLQATMPMMKLLGTGATIHPAVTKVLLDSMSLPSEKHLLVKFNTAYAFYACFWAMVIAKYVNFRSQGVKMNAVKFEHLITNPLENTRIILEYCGLPGDWASDGVKALENDSQRNSIISAKRLKNYPASKLSNDILEDCNTFCKKFDLAPFLENHEVEGTITKMPKDGTKLDNKLKAV